MAKIDDFGGIPETVFTALINDLANTALLGLTTQQRLDIFKAIADEEHAAANSTKQANPADVAILAIRLNDLFDLLRSGTATAATIPSVTATLGALKNLW